MSACFVLKQRKAVHLISDCAAYKEDGILTSVTYNKCIALPAIKAAFAGVGRVKMADKIAAHISYVFTSFDELVDEAENYLPDLFSQLADVHYDGDAHGTFYIAGWSDRGDRPEAYAINLWSNKSSHLAWVLRNSPNGSLDVRSKLESCEISGTPMPGPDLLAQGRFRVPSDPNRMHAARDLMHLLEIARHEKVDGKHWIGGTAVLTSVDRRGVSQRVVRTWAEDRLGAPILPRAANS